MNVRLKSTVLVSHFNITAYGNKATNSLVQMMAHHEHIEVLVYGVPGEGPCWVGGGRDHVLLATHPYDVRGVTSPRPLGMVGVNGSVPERLYRLLHAGGLVQGVGVDHHLGHTVHST